MSLIQIWGRRFFLGVALLLTPSLWGEEVFFPSLTAGSVTYSNVTVTSKTPGYVIIMHAHGLSSIKLKDLSGDVAKQLGYQVNPTVSKTRSFMPANLALDPKFKARAEETMDELKDQFRQLDPMLLKIDLAGLLLLYLLFCYCGMLICKKTGHEPGGLIWVPVLQIIPLLKGAGLSAWWFLLWVIPVANIFPIIFWCVKICRARGKNPCLAVLLVLPLINIFTFLYLAFADSANDQAKPLVRKVNFG